MNDVAVQIGGLSVHSPVSALTNLALAVQAAWYAALLSRHGGIRGTMWPSFFAALAVGAALGVLKHGFPHLLASMGTSVVRGGSNLALCAGVVSLILGTVHHHGRRSSTIKLLHFVAGLFAGTALALNLRSQAMGPTGLLMAAGVMPVLFVETWCAARFRHSAASSLGVGLWIALIGGLAFALDVSPSPWFTRTDVAHVAFLLGLPWLYRGARHRLGGQAPGRVRSWS